MNGELRIKLMHGSDYAAGTDSVAITVGRDVIGQGRTFEMCHYLSCECISSQRSALRAAMQPNPAAVIACR